MKPRALDLFCGAGGATKGLQRAGFHVTGVDIKPQPRYCGDAFVQGDALNFPIRDNRNRTEFDFIWASPPCQAYSITKSVHGDLGHPRLIEPIRIMLRQWATYAGGMFVIENVIGAPLHSPILLCGTMFGLCVYRHRLFETNFFILVPPHAKHTQGSTGSHRGYSRGNPMVCVAGHNFKREEGEEAMGIDWMTSRAQLSQAIPPAYSEFIGRAALNIQQRASE